MKVQDSGSTQLEQRALHFQFIYILTMLKVLTDEVISVNRDKHKTNSKEIRTVTFEFPPKKFLTHP